jgi:hypothetical protein
MWNKKVKKFIVHFLNDKWELYYATFKSFEIVDTSRNAMALKTWLIYLQNTSLKFDSVLVYGPKTKGIIFTPWLLY